MHKLTAVEEAKALMSEAKDWSVWRWLLEKGKVRATADQATAALGALENEVKAAWGEDVKKAYRALEGWAGGNGGFRKLNPDIQLAIQRVKEADDKAEDARLDAEATFDEAERRLNANLARDGAQKAIDSWELREKAIRRAEALARKQAAAHGE